MAKLIHTGGPGGAQTIELSGTPLTIGRRDDNALCLKDSFVSGAHAVVAKYGNLYAIEDLKSSNGTLVNGQRITSHPLENGDTITIGRHQLLFQDGSGGQTMDADKTMIFSGPLSKPATTGGGGSRPAMPAEPLMDRSMELEPMMVQALIKGGSAASAKSGAPAAAAPLELPSIEGLEATLIPPPPAAAPKTTPGAGELPELDELVGSIRSHRDREKQEREQAEARILSEWQKVLTYAEQLKARIGSDARVKYFSADRRLNEVLIRTQATPSARVRLIQITPQHPDHPTGPKDGIWVRLDREDSCYPQADAAVRELLRELAFLLA